MFWPLSPAFLNVLATLTGLFKCFGRPHQYCFTFLTSTYITVHSLATLTYICTCFCHPHQSFICFGHPNQSFYWFWPITPVFYLFQSSPVFLNSFGHSHQSFTWCFHPNQTFICLGHPVELFLCLATFSIILYFVCLSPLLGCVYVYAVLCSHWRLTIFLGNHLLPL